MIPVSVAAQAGFQPGDVIHAFDGINNPDWELLVRPFAAECEPDRAADGRRAEGKVCSCSLQIPASAKSDDFDLSDAGILPQYYARPDCSGRGATGLARGAGGIAGRRRD